jgi:hypothetical protein
VSDTHEILRVSVGFGGSAMRTTSLLFFGSSSPPVPATVPRPGGFRGGGMSAFGCGFGFMARCHLLSSGVGLRQLVMSTPSLQSTS